ncbi:regulator of G-protein signaling 1-like [Protopterus annectens]|uniref:regulator of G-protein signaling 1-like n=1 Tax=Protopterus annectens TaxID=7888 RepID=UPI001CFBB6B1|nr:regulator of G-protein signaling 1-like [Protopterus annectens]
MPGLFFPQTHPAQLKESSCNPSDEKGQKKKPKTFGMDLKTCLRSILPHLESNITAPKPTKVSADDCNKWSQSLEKLLESQAGLAVFKAFLKSEYSDENIQFWLACEDYKRTKSPGQMASKAQKIFEEFVQEDSSKEINIDFHTRDTISKKKEDPTPSCFDEAQKIVYGLMERDSYPRFLKSEIYQNHVCKTKD